MDTWASNMNLREMFIVDIPSVDKSRWEYTSDKLNSACNNYIDCKDYHQVFTDGSKDTYGTGAAVYDPIENIEVKLKIRYNLSVMFKALSYISSLNYYKIVILSDSKSALQHIIGATTNYRSSRSLTKVI